MNPPIGAGACFSPEKTFRFALWRRWDLSKPMVMFIGLNPSTANEKKNDPTIGRVIDFAKDAGFGGIYMMNLFAFVTAYPRKLPRTREANEVENDNWLAKVQLECDRVVFCWGAFGQAKRLAFIRERAAVVANLFPDAYCLGKTQGGYPCHPLFLPGDTKLEPFQGSIPQGPPAQPQPKTKIKG